MSSQLTGFVDNYLHARETALQSHFARGTSGMEVEWNVLDSGFCPMHQVGSGAHRESFIDALTRRHLPPSIADRHVLEVFHWMTEWITRPYYSPIGTIYEARLLEACLLNILSEAGLMCGERLYVWHGNVPWPIRVTYESIPDSIELAKRRYFERCIDMFGSALATAGVHSNLSLPEPLLSLDLVHRTPAGPGGQDLVAYRNEVYISAARVHRAFSAMFGAVMANSPLRAEWRDGEPVLLLTDDDSVRLMQFPNPPELDVPDLYRSHADYVRISHDLVRRGVRFGNNNWTPTRARSDREYVERLIHITSDQLEELHRKGLYRHERPGSADEVARRIQTANMLARVDIPMARVELRTDEGGQSLDLDIASLMLKELLLIRSYADPGFGAAFTYDAECIGRARRNEALAAQRGLRAIIEHPFTGTGVPMREFLAWTIEQVRELAMALDWWGRLEPLRAMAGGQPSAAERLRARLRREIGDDNIVPVQLMQQLAVQREEEVQRDVRYIVDHLSDLGVEAPKLHDLVQRARDAAGDNPSPPIRFDLGPAVAAVPAEMDKTTEIVELARQLIRIPSVTTGGPERLEDVHRAARFVAGYLRDAGLTVRLYADDKYPSVFAHFPGRLGAPAMLSGHFDVVQPDPDDGQFEPFVDGDYLWGRGAADMKTVVATYMVWMRDTIRRNVSPPLNLLLVGNEEMGETEPAGTPHVLAELMNENGYAPRLMIVGERTGEKGDELAGSLGVENRGVYRLEIVAFGEKGHTGTGEVHDDLAMALFAAREYISGVLTEGLTLKAADGWTSEFRFPFINVGTCGTFNITPDSARLGLEIRPIPQDDVSALVEKIEDWCRHRSLQVNAVVTDPGVRCNRENPYLQRLERAVRETFGIEPVISRKKPGTSGRFAPNGNAVIWGQSGIGPHSPNERHYIPSIKGYYDALTRYAELITV